MKQLRWQMWVNKVKQSIAGVFLLVWATSCVAPLHTGHSANKQTPQHYANQGSDTTSIAALKWQQFFRDPYLQALIDTALGNNQELNILLQEIEIARNEARARKGEYLPFVNIAAGAGVDKVARYTSRGAMEATTDIEPGRAMPEPLGDFSIGAVASWEVDVWKRLRNSRKSAVLSYLATVEGRNFAVTRLVSEMAAAYYELLALDNQLVILQNNIAIQQDALDIVRMQKNAAQVTELAVKRFEAQVLRTRALQYDIRQRITVTENHINFLAGRFPQPIARSESIFADFFADSLPAGVPAQLLQYRPDITQAELALQAAALDVKVARANFYPRVGISAGVGLRAFDPSFLMETPESMAWSLAGDLVAPLVNRNAIKAAYYGANARQIQVAYDYEQRLINAFVEVSNQLATINNMRQRFELKSQEVDALSRSVQIANVLFTSARADYMEVLLTQREALDARFDLVETRQRQLMGVLGLYRALGGGWQ